MVHATGRPISDQMHTVTGAPELTWRPLHKRGKLFNIKCRKPIAALVHLSQAVLLISKILLCCGHMHHFGEGCLEASSNPAFRACSRKP